GPERILLMTIGRARGWRRSCRLGIAELRARVCACALFIAAIMGCGSALAAPADFIHADGTRLVDGHGDSFVVKGINLGNWLVPEGYMFKFKQARSPKEIAGVVEALVGPEE